ncbi:DUF1003 domain-containing protein [Dysgonomonas sp.]
MKYFKSYISGKEYPENEKIQLMLIRNNILDFIKLTNPTVDDSKYISLQELDEYRLKYIEYSLKNESDNLSSLENEVINKIKNNEFISSNLDTDYQTRLTLGQRVADKVATFGGSWKFIISFFIIIVLWVGLNSYSIIFKVFDPYPFILLNLFLSCLAAFQAPIIMMSQNRQEDKDRDRAKEDYKVNLKSEMEIQILQEKVDHLVLIQQQKLFEIQDIQIEMLKEITSNISKLTHSKNK